MHHALAKLRAKKLLFDDVYPAIDYAAQPEPVHVLKLETRIVSPPPGSRPDDLDVLLEQIALQEETIAQARRIIEARREMLQQAIVNAEALLPAPVVAEESIEASGSKKNKKPKKAAAVDLRACGYDSRLAADDAEVLAMLKTEGDAAEGEVCPASRRCDRHQGWQKTIAVELEVEMALNVSILSWWRLIDDAGSAKRPTSQSVAQDQKRGGKEGEGEGNLVSVADPSFGTS
jgi:hypothetical protein